MNKLIPFFCLLLVGCNPSIKTIYVSSLGEFESEDKNAIVVSSIENALLKVLEIRKSDINNLISILIKSGEYRLQKPLRITSAHGFIEIIGDGLNYVTIKGSKKLNLTWESYSENIWVAKVDNVVDFDQLFINDKQQILARYPNYNEDGGHWQGHAADVISPERIKSWKHPVGTIVHAMHSGEWGDFHYQITKLNNDGTVEFNGGHQNNRPSKMHDSYRMVENVFEELDSPGEWFLDKEKKLLYYWPAVDLDLKMAVVEGTELEHLVEIIGTEINPVENVSISGIKFEHTKRTFMEDYEPLLRSDWTIYRGGAVYIEGTENVSLENCEFSNLGGNVIFVSKYNRNVKIEGNHIHDTGASAISFVGDPSAVRSPSYQYGEFVSLSEMDTIKGPANNKYPSECIVNNNLIYRIGRVEKQVAGVQISMSMNITVSSNSIYDVPRAGINVSEGTWGGHKIIYNDVFNTVLETSDHGAFNSWGRDRFWHPNRLVMDKLTSDNPNMPYWDAIHTTEISNNRFRCDHGWDIDLDDGSSNYHLYNNVCLNGGIKLREGFYRTVENNIMINNSFHPHVWFENSGDVFRKNIGLAEYKDIRLGGWGNEVDHNLFPDELALKKAQKNGTDTHSLFGNPEFQDPENGNYTVSRESPALKVGFKNIDMNKFGVQKSSLKAIAKKPDFPIIWSVSDSNIEKTLTINWLGVMIKNIETIEERSASGLNKTAGVLILDIANESILFKSKLKIDDVIVGGEGEEINQISDLMKVYQGNNWKGKINLLIIRNQKPLKLEIALK